VLICVVIDFDDVSLVMLLIYVVTILTLTKRRHGSIFVVFDTLTKTAHFIPMHNTYQAPYIARVFINKIVSLNGVPRRIISDRGSVFTGHFWTSFQEEFGMQLNFSTTYHLEIDGKIERTNQILEDMLRLYVMDQHKHWEEFFPLVELCTKKISRYHEDDIV
jgi:transposase InsO family protein